MTNRQIELFVPAITPFAADLSVDKARFLAQAKSLLVLNPETGPN